MSKETNVEVTIEVVEPDEALITEEYVPVENAGDGIGEGK